MHELKTGQVSPDSASEFLREVLKMCKEKFVPLVSKCSDSRGKSKLPCQVLQIIHEKNNLWRFYIESHSSKISQNSHKANCKIMINGPRTQEQGIGLLNFLEPIGKSLRRVSLNLVLHHQKYFGSM